MDCLFRCSLIFSTSILQFQYKNLVHVLLDLLLFFFFLFLDLSLWYCILNVSFPKFIDFCLLVLQLVNLLSSLIGSRRIFLYFFGLQYIDNHVIYKQGEFCFFLFSLCAFYFLAQVGISNIMLNSVVRAGILALFLILGGMHSGFLPHV